MTQTFEEIVSRHRACFQSGKTRPVEWREQQLAAVRSMVTERADVFCDALWKDLRRNKVDATVADLKAVADEADYARRRVRHWMKTKSERTPFFLWPGRTTVRFEPLGVGLIIGAWNSIQLVLSPLIAALSGGNAGLLKPSEVSPASAAALAELVPQYLDPDAVSVVTGGVAETTALLEQKWDHIFFTGGTSIGRIVMTAAKPDLTPVVLELQHENFPRSSTTRPTSRLAARRIAHGRWLNAGQTCTAPDYVLVSKSVAPEFLGHLKAAALDFYGADPQKSPDFGRVVSPRHFDRLKELLEESADPSRRPARPRRPLHRAHHPDRRAAGRARAAGRNLRTDPAGAGSRRRRPCLCGALRSVSSCYARAMRPIAAVWRGEHPDGECPTPQRLKDDKLVDVSSKLSDAWGGPFV